MNYIQSIIKNRIVHMILAIIAFLVVCTATIIALTIDSKDYNMEQLNEGWSVVVGGREYKNIDIVKDDKYRENLDNITSSKSNTITFTKKINKKLAKMVEMQIKTPILAIETKSCPIDVYVGNKKVGKNYSNEKTNIKGCFYVDFPDNCEGKLLKIECKVIDNTTVSIIEDIFVISEDNYFMYKLRNNLLKHIVGTFMIVLGIILSTVSMVIPNKRPEFNKLIWIGGVCLFGGVGFYAKFDLLDLYVNNIYVTENVTYICLFVCIINILLMARNIYTNKKLKTIMTYYIIVISAVYIMFVIFHNLNIAKYSSVSVEITISMIISVIALIFFNHSNIGQIKPIEKIFTVGTSLCYLEILGIFIMATVNKVIDWNGYGKYALLIIFITFLFVLMLYYANVLNYYMEQITEKNVLYHVAYTDFLTELSNRARYEEVVEEMKEKNLENTMIVSFDLDNLKVINDNVGHDAGDIYIKTFARALKKKLNNYGIVCRTGGDEFCAIIKDKPIEIKNIIEQIQNMFEEDLIEERWKENISFSYGYACGSELKDTDIEELINLADKRMYEYKAAYKRKRNMRKDKKKTK